ncbi:hypothetical protein D3C85_1272450 [compost metagenome]
MQLGLAICAALDVHLGSDGEGNDLLHRIGVAAHCVGIDQTHVEAKAAASVILRQGQGQLVEVTEATRQLDEVLAVDEVEGEPLHAHAGGQTGEDYAELVITDVCRPQGHHALELGAEVDAVILYPCDGLAVVEIDAGRKLARVGCTFELGAGGDLPISRCADIPFVVVAKIDHLGADLEGGSAGETIR